MSSPPKPLHDPYAALRFKDFRRYLIGNFLLIFGSQMTSTAIGWELYGNTGRALDLGLMGFFYAAPYISLGLLAGNVADRFNRRVVIVISTVLYGLCLIGLAGASAFKANLPHFNYIVFVISALAGTFDVFHISAKSALFRQLVPPADLPNAVTWGSGTFQAAAVTGPAVCGFLLARIPNYIIYSGAVIFDVIFILVLLSLRLNRQSSGKSPISLKSIAEGAQFVYKTKPILATITLDLFAVLLGGCTALLPIFVKDILQTGPETLGWLRAAPAVGAIVMALFVVRSPMTKPGLTLLWAVAGFGTVTVVFGFSRNIWLSLAMMFLIGALDNISVIVRGTLVQVLTPDRLLGRVQSVNFLFISSSNELGAFESGVAAQFLGPVAAVVLGGVAAIGIVLWVHWTWPQIAAMKALQKHKRASE